MANNKLSELATIVKLARVTKGWSQEDLAKKAGVSTCSISFLENCKKKPRDITVVKIGKALKIDIKDLLDFVS